MFLENKTVGLQLKASNHIWHIDIEMCLLAHWISSDNKLPVHAADRSGTVMSRSASY